MGCPELRTLIDWVKSGRPPRPESEQAAKGLVEEATRQRVAPLLYAAVTRDSDGWPASSIEGLRERYHSAFARGARQLDLAARLMGAFERAGLRVLPLKAVALAASAYDSVAERPMGDIDLLALDDWNASVRLLEDAGLVEGARADHAWSFHLRWELSRGRRWAFVEGTCAPTTPGQELDHWQQARRVLARISGLLRRWL